MLDKHYGMVITFSALNKELYSLKQGSGENVAEFRVHLLQQVQILQLEYPGRIQQEHMEEMKQDHSYKGLNPTYWHMLAHKGDCKQPASYSNLIVAAQKLERQAEARYKRPLLPKTTTKRPDDVSKIPFLNPDPLNWWSRPENIAQFQIKGESSWVLLDSASTINTVTPEFVKVQSLDIGPLSDLSDSTLGINGMRGVFSWPLGYVIIRA